MQVIGSTAAMWQTRWPYVAKQSCVDALNDVSPEFREQVRFELPCDTCEKNTECLTGKEKEVGSLMFDREYHTKPRAASSSLFPFERMEPCLDRKLSLLEWFRKPVGLESRFAVCSGYDIAWSERSGGDYFATITARLDRQTGDKRILDIDRWRQVSFERQMQIIEERHNKFHDDVVVIETDGAQAVWKQYLTSTTAVPVVGHSAGKKRDFEQGVPGLLRDIERQKWQIPYAPGSYKIENVKAFLSELEAFGWLDDKLEGVGEHDDLVMAWYHTDHGLEKMRRPSQDRRVRSRTRRGEL